MERRLYEFVQLGAARYFFISEGKQRIAKVVKFAPFGITDIINLSFGDLLEDNSIDDSSNSNNGDIIQVLSTVVDIVRHFTLQNPQANVYIEGIDESRKRLYERILKTYYPI